MIPLEAKGTISLWDVNGHTITLRNETYEHWIAIEAAIQSGSPISFTVTGDPHKNTWKSKQIQYGGGQIVRAEFEEAR